MDGLRILLVPVRILKGHAKLFTVIHPPGCLQSRTASHRICSHSEKLHLPPCSVVPLHTGAPAACSTVCNEHPQLAGGCGRSVSVSTAKLISAFCVCIHVSVRLCVLHSLMPLVRVPGPYSCKPGVPHLTSTLQMIENYRSVTVRKWSAIQVSAAAHLSAISTLDSH